MSLTVGGNDLGYTASLYAECISPWVSRVPFVVDRLRLATEPSRNADRRADATDALVLLLGEVRRRAPQTVIMCIDYFTVLPATFRGDLPLNAAQHQHILALADDLNGALAAAARHQQVELVSASQHSVEYHSWSGDPWKTGWSNPVSVARIGVPPEIVNNATTKRDSAKASSEAEHQLLGTKSFVGWVGALRCD